MMAKQVHQAPVTAGRKRRGGFTLVEVLVATALLGTVMLGVAGTATMGAHEMRRSKAISVATIKAREAIDEIMAKGYDAATAGQTVQDADAGRFTMQVLTTIQERSDADGLKDVTVSVVGPKGRELQRFWLSIQKEDK